MEPATGQIRRHTDGAIGWLVIDAEARRNAMTAAMWRDLPDHLSRLDQDRDVRVIIVRGAGEKAFVSGADISEFDTTRRDADTNRAFVADVRAVQAAFAALTKPCIAMIHGFCMGGGVLLAGECDLRIASNDARFGIPAGRLGLGYEAEGVRRLVNLVGPANALDLICTARQAEAREMAAMGFLSRIAPADQLEQVTRELAAQIASNAPLTLKAARIAVLDALANPGGTVAPEVQAAIDACFDSANFREGRSAFLGKRPPVFQNH